MNIFITEKYYLYCSIIDLEDYLDKNKDSINWNIMSAHPRLTNELAEEYKNYINWDTYNKYREVFKDLRRYYSELYNADVLREIEHDKVYINSISIIHQESYAKQHNDIEAIKESIHKSDVGEAKPKNIDIKNMKIFKDDNDTKDEQQSKDTSKDDKFYSSRGYDYVYRYFKPIPYKKKPFSQIRCDERYERHDECRNSFSCMCNILPSQIICENEEAMLQALNSEYEYSENYDYNYYEYNNKTMKNIY